VAPSEPKLLRIYLQDHETVLVAGRQLVRRMLRRPEIDPELARFLSELLVELEDDRRLVVERLRAANGSPSLLKTSAARLAVEAGRLKLNGSIREPSPLSPLLELEGVLMTLEQSRALWRALERTDRSPTDDYGARARRATDRAEGVEQQRLRAAEAALAPESEAS
jgi:hypothetical protein